LDDWEDYNDDYDLCEPEDGGEGTATDDRAENPAPRRKFALSRVQIAVLLIIAALAAYMAINHAPNSPKPERSKTEPTPPPSQSEVAVISGGYNGWTAADADGLIGREVYYKLESVVVLSADIYEKTNAADSVTSRAAACVLTVKKVSTGEIYQITVPYEKYLKVKAGLNLSVHFGYIDVGDQRILVDARY
jgi:hypothetical protein